MKEKGTPRVIIWPYKKASESIDLQFDRVTGEAFLPGIGWASEGTLRALGYTQQKSIKHLPKPKAIPFGSPAKYQGKWVTSRPHGSAEGTGKFI